MQTFNRMLRPYQAERVAASRPGGLDPTQFGSAAAAARTPPGPIDPLAAGMQVSRYPAVIPFVSHA